MPIVAQGQPLPPFDSLSYQEEVQLFDGASTLVRRAGHTLRVEIVAARSVGNQGDMRVYDVTAVLVPLNGYALSADAAGALATSIINEVKGIGRVLFDVTPGKTEGGSS